MVGFFNIYKPKDVSSAFVVSQFKKKVRQKCGHMGTLDPLASGVLPIGVNQANRLFGFLLDKVKTYTAVFDFAFHTPSYDLETEPVQTKTDFPTLAELQAVLPKFVGNLEQIPPEYSAKMVNGVRSYKLARHGEKVELPPKTVEVLGIKITRQLSESAFEFVIDCRGGTYIRSLARDIGNEFGMPSTMTALERTACGVFTKQNAVSINDFLDSDDVLQYLIKPENVVSYPSFVLQSYEATRLLNGLADTFDVTNGLYKVFNQAEFWGVGQAVDGKIKMKAFVRDL